MSELTDILESKQLAVNALPTIMSDAARRIKELEAARRIKELEEAITLIRSAPDIGSSDPISLIQSICDEVL